MDFFFGLPGIVTLNRLGFKDPEAGVKKWVENIELFRSEMHLFPDVREVMDTLLAEKKASLGCVTSKLLVEMQHDFAAFDIAKYFEFTVNAADTVKHKPDSEPMHKYLEIAKCDAKDAIYIGDTVYDMQCANGAGVDFAMATWNGHEVPQEIREHAAVLLSKPSDILDLVR